MAECSQSLLSAGLSAHLRRDDAGEAQALVALSDELRELIDAIDALADDLLSSRPSRTSLRYN